MNIYVIRTWNKHGGCIGDYYVVAEGVNAAKRAFREREPNYVNGIIKNISVVDVHANVLVVTN